MFWPDNGQLDEWSHEHLLCYLSRNRTIFIWYDFTNSTGMISRFFLAHTLTECAYTWRPSKIWRFGWCAAFAVSVLFVSPCFLWSMVLWLPCLLSGTSKTWGLFFPQRDDDMGLFLLEPLLDLAPHLPVIISMDLVCPAISYCYPYFYHHYARKKKSRKKELKFKRNSRTTKVPWLEGL